MNDFSGAAETLAGDLRDALLTHVRSMQTPWSKMSEDQQRDKIYAVERAAQDAVRRAVAVISGRGFDNVRATLGKFSVDGGKVKGTFETIVSEANVVSLSDHQGQTVLLVLADAADFMGESAPAEPDPDQPSLPVENDALPQKARTKKSGGAPDGGEAGESGPSPARDAGPIPAFMDRHTAQASA